MSSLPSGTFTFLFTDIEGSTALWEQYHEGMKAVLSCHDALVQRAISSHAGTIVKTTGDGLLAAFENAGQALAAALSIQQAILAETWPEINPRVVRVRIGIHSGEAERREGDYFGPALNRAARLMSVGYGGQILVSSSSAELGRDFLPEGASLRDLGEHRLKDLVRPEHIYQLIHPSLPSEFPPLRSLDALPNNLPVQLTSFIGRQQEMEEIQALLSSIRLVTLTGSGGTGKSRLSLEVAAQELPAFPQGAWLVELAPLTDPSQVLPELMQVFELREQPSTPPLSIVKDYLRDKKVLLILDNCEHLIDACARLADDLLHACSGLKILASSREALGIAGEAAYRIPSLAEKEAVQLFTERARFSNPHFAITENNTASVSRICARLDGIPLAIELAAARTRALSPDQIASRLDDRFRLLVGGSRTALPRQQTLRALIDWSYDLLSEDERRLLRIASVFMGGWTLEALEAVAEDPSTVEILDQLASKSLVVTDDCSSRMRYALLETIRQYAREKLLDSGLEEAARARSRHLAYFVKLAEASVSLLTGPEMVESLDELEQEQDNLRAAIEWGLQTDPISVLRLGAILTPFWARRLSAEEGRTWVRSALARAAEKYADLEGEQALPYRMARAVSLSGQASLDFLCGDNLSARTAIEASIAQARLNLTASQPGSKAALESANTLASSLAIGVIIMGLLSDFEAVMAFAKEARALAQQYGFAYVLAILPNERMIQAVLQDQPVSSDVIDEMLQDAHRSGNPWALGMAHSDVGRVKMLKGQYDEAQAYLEEAGGLFWKIRDMVMFYSNKSEIGHLKRRQGSFPEALGIYRQTLQYFRESGHRAAVAHELECFGFIAAAQGQNERAAHLLGTAEALREQIHSDMTFSERQEYTRIVSDLRQRMDEDILSKAWSEGRSLDIDRAIKYAIEFDTSL